MCCLIFVHVVCCLCELVFLLFCKLLAVNSRHGLLDDASSVHSQEEPVRNTTSEYVEENE